MSLKGMVTGKEICYSDKDWHGFSVLMGQRYGFSLIPPKLFVKFFCLGRKKQADLHKNIKKGQSLRTSLLFSINGFCATQDKP